MKTKQQIIERLDQLDLEINEFVFYSQDEYGQIEDDEEYEQFDDLIKERDCLKEKLSSM